MKTPTRVKAKGHKTILFYDPVITFRDPEAKEDNSVSIDVIRATREAVSEERGNVFLRDASLFDGNTEADGNTYPDVLLWGPDDSPHFERIRAAFEETGADVQEYVPDESSDAGTSAGGEESDPVHRMALLKEEATALGIQFASNIGEEALRGRIEAKRRELEAAGVANSGGGTGQSASDGERGMAGTGGTGTSNNPGTETKVDKRER